MLQLLDELLQGLSLDGSEPVAPDGGTDDQGGA